MPAVFCYGTLEFPEIMEAVTGRRFPHAAAVLKGYARFLIKDANYPGIIEATGGSVAGTLYRDIDPHSLKRLDAYEDSVYVRQIIEVWSIDDENIPARVYVIPPHRRWMLSSKPWNKERFARVYLDKYLSRLKCDKI